MAKKSCKKGYYYCFTSEKCKKIPRGWHLMASTGRIMKDSEHKEEEETKKNGNGTNGNGSGNGDSSGSSNGGGVSEGWSAKYKKSIDCDNPKGFSQRAHCQGRKKVNEAKERGDHEVSMAQSQLAKTERNIKTLRKALGKKEKNIPAWLQAKITDTEHNMDAAAGYMENPLEEANKSGDSSLRDWFTKSRASDGTPGWVQLGGKYAGKPCAKQPGQKTKPKCGSSKMKADLSDKEEEKAFRRKNRKDKNPNRRGKAKNVSTESYEIGGEQLNELWGKVALAAGAAALPYLMKKFGKPAVDKELDKHRKAKPSDYSVKGGLGAYAARSRTGGLENLSPDLKRQYMGNSYDPKGELVENEKKDACYKKVKSRYKIWPSAYASGALVKCRKVGAANWGNTSEGYEFSNWRDDFAPMEVESVDIVTPQPLQPTKGIGSEMLGEKCWDGYVQKGMKKKGKKVVPNCVKEEEKKVKRWWDDDGDGIGWEEGEVKKSKKKKKTRKEGYSNWRGELSETKEPIDINKSPKKRAQQDAMRDMGSTPYDPNEGKRRGKKILDRLLGQPDIQDEYIPEDWQKVNKKDKTDGMSQKAVNAYRRENPGSKLKTAVTEKNPGGKRAKRRKSFCARSNGQRKMHNIDCSKTPDKAICKARKRWRC